MQTSQYMQRLVFADRLTMRSLVTYTADEVDILNNLLIADIILKIRVADQLHQSGMLRYIPTFGQIHEFRPELQCLAGTDNGFLRSNQLEVLRIAAVGIQLLKFIQAV